MSNAVPPDDGLQCSRNDHIRAPRRCCFDRNGTVSGRMSGKALYHDGPRHASACPPVANRTCKRSEEHTSELQSLMRISYAVFCLKKKKIEKLHLTNLFDTYRPSPIHNIIRITHPNTTPQRLL